ncbi:peptide-N4-(N-acetyl-beta- glucosaminyl)asparagine amidase [Nowakowskiella sp. JEL0407]|nr:peptide-N4-(N-acetyl-beta- glucosaminyl)asparagine amidase [Nowakowskiella sp. JEL0407]
MNHETITLLCSRFENSIPSLIEDTPERIKFFEEIKSQSVRVRVYDDIDLQSKALEEIPVDILHEAAQKSFDEWGMNKGSECQAVNSFKDELMRHLMDWYKKEYFSWVNAPACDYCGSQTTLEQHSTGTPEEQRYGGSRVEIYKCGSCSNHTRFPRYNDLIKLMQTRRGRCGEWANVFCLFTKAMGFESRYVHDYTDHVWVEIYSEAKDRWDRYQFIAIVAKAQKHLIPHEAGWGKNLDYIFAYGTYEVVDVIMRYTNDISKIIPRRKRVSERWLSKALRQYNQTLQNQLPQWLKEEIQTRADAERKELASYSTIQRTPQSDEMLGRQSGSIEWKKMRGEIGKGGSTAGQTVHTPSKGALLVDAFKSPINFVGCAKYSNVKVTSDKTVRSLQITPAENDRLGAVYLPEQMPISPGFIVEFGFFIKSNGQSADGMAFVIQNDSPASIGIGGCGLGYQGIRKSVAIEFDCYRSEDTCNDPDGNHISVHTRGSEPNSAHQNFSKGCTNKIPHLASGAPYFCRIEYSHSDEVLKILLTDEVMSKDGSFEGENFSTVLEVKGLNIAEKVSGASAWIGFTGSTGGLNESHDVFSWKVFKIGN